MGYFRKEKTESFKRTSEIKLNEIISVRKDFRYLELDIDYVLILTDMRVIIKFHDLGLNPVLELHIYWKDEKTIVARYERSEDLTTKRELKFVVDHIYEDKDFNHFRRIQNKPEALVSYLFDYDHVDDDDQDEDDELGLGDNYKRYGSHDFLDEPDIPF